MPADDVDTLDCFWSLTRDPPADDGGPALKSLDDRNLMRGEHIQRLRNRTRRILDRHDRQWSRSRRPCAKPVDHVKVREARQQPAPPAEVPQRGLVRMRALRTEIKNGNIHKRASLLVQRLLIQTRLRVAFANSIHGSSSLRNSPKDADSSCCGASLKAHWIGCASMRRPSAPAASPARAKPNHTPQRRDQIHDHRQRESDEQRHGSEIQQIARRLVERTEPALAKHHLRTTIDHQIPLRQPFSTVLAMPL